MKSSVLVVLLITATPLAAQYFIAPPPGELVHVVDGTFATGDTMGLDRHPSFPGGRIEMYRWLENRIHLSTPAREEVGAYGQTLVRFRLDAAGRVSDVAILRTTTPSLDLVIERAVRTMPAWEPAVKDGVETAILVYLPLGYSAEVNQLILDESTSKAIAGRSGKSNWWLKAVLVVGALALVAGLIFGLR